MVLCAATHGVPGPRRRCRTARRWRPGPGRALRPRDRCDCAGAREGESPALCGPARCGRLPRPGDGVPCPGAVRRGHRDLRGHRQRGGHRGGRPQRPGRQPATWPPGPSPRWSTRSGPGVQGRAPAWPSRSGSGSRSRRASARRQCGRGRGAGGLQRAVGRRPGPGRAGRGGREGRQRRRVRAARRDEPWAWAAATRSPRPWPRGTYHWVLAFAAEQLSTPAVYAACDRLRAAQRRDGPGAAAAQRAPASGTAQQPPAAQPVVGTAARQPLTGQPVTSQPAAGSWPAPELSTALMAALRSG